MEGVDFQTPTKFILTASRHDNDQHHLSGAPMCPIRCRDACECVSLLTWCFSPFPPPLKCADTRLLSNQRTAYGEHTLIRADTHTQTHLENPGTLKEEDNVLPLHPSIMLCDPKNVRRNSKPHCLEDILPCNCGPVTTP